MTGVGVTLAISPLPRLRRSLSRQALLRFSPISIKCGIRGCSVLDTPSAKWQIIMTRNETRLNSNWATLDLRPRSMTWLAYSTLLPVRYVTIYNRAADPQGANFWATTLGFANINVAAGAQATPEMADALGRNFYQASSGIFNTTYPESDSNSLFITKVYNNLGGSDPDGGGLNYWTDRVATLSLTNSLQVARAMTATEIALALENFIPNPGDIAANLRAQTFQNKIAVSKAVASTNNPVFNPASQSLTDPAYLGETNILVGVTNTEASKSVALSQVATANAANNPALMVGQFVASVALTPGIDTGPTFDAQVDGFAFKGLPALSPLGINNNTLNFGDTLTNTKAFKDVSLSFTAITPSILGGNPVFATDVNISGVQTANIANQSGGATGGFSGNVSGLTKVNVAASTNGAVQLGGAVVGAIAAQGLKTSLTDVSIAASQNFTAVIAAAALTAATDTVNVTLDNNFGAKAPVGTSNFVRLYARRWRHERL